MVSGWRNKPNISIEEVAKLARYEAYFDSLENQTSKNGDREPCLTFLKKILSPNTWKIIENSILEEQKSNQVKVLFLLARPKPFPIIIIHKSSKFDNIQDL